MRLAKLHGLGNDFLVALDEQHDAPVEVDAALARALCDRRTGVGADGVIVGRRPPAGDDADLVMLLRNSDGSVAELSGNGLRCLAHAVALVRGVDELELRIATGGGPRRAVVRGALDDCTVAVGMGTARPGPQLPAGLDRGRRTATVDVGNPHVVLLVDDPAAVDLATEGAAIEQAVDGGINAEFVRIDDRGAITLVVWERGAGVTQACGTGACAAVHAAHAWGLVDDEVRVSMPGGTATVLVGDELTLVGPSVHVADVAVGATWLGGARG